ncbi:MAG: heparan-alpha-glucosaminide N-acetyltransferase domain-containing protein [Zoogloea sp.]|nr:heparan-alpha-glucosaminide N-acetyltransferase domain-containing protein [Zoogloea sp.]
MQAPAKERLTSIDALRGSVMLLMLVDHVREYFYLHQQVSDPMLIGATAPALFFTRLTSHVCAPIFVLLTGLSARLYGSKAGRGPGDTAAYLAKRGLLLVALELTVINFAWSFAFPPPMFYLQVIWVIGLSMLALAALLWLPSGVQLALASLILCGHNLLDGIHFASGSPGFIPWAILHDRSIIDLGGGLQARTSYPLLPWIGIILAGYLLGGWYGPDTAPNARARRLALAGGAAVAGFVLLRWLNSYGDARWAPGATAIETAMSFLNITKYPPSLQFSLLTLGLGLLALGWLERVRPWPALIRFGSVPMFFYVVHLYALHLLHDLLGALNAPGDGSRYGLSAVWQIWALAVLVALAMYWPCRWFARIRRTTSAGWLSYF